MLKNNQLLSEKYDAMLHAVQGKEEARAYINRLRELVSRLRLV